MSNVRFRTLVEGEDLERGGGKTSTCSTLMSVMMRDVVDDSPTSSLFEFEFCDSLVGLNSRYWVVVCIFCFPLVSGIGGSPCFDGGNTR